MILRPKRFPILTKLDLQLSSIKCLQPSPSIEAVQFNYPDCNMSPLPRRAIISVTSATAPLHEGHPTGLFISEALHPFNVFKAAGIETDLVSEKGTYGVDWLSEQPSFLPPDDKKQWEDLNGEFRQKLDNMITPAKVDASNVRYENPVDQLNALKYPKTHLLVIEIPLVLIQPFYSMASFSPLPATPRSSTTLPRPVCRTSPKPSGLMAVSSLQYAMVGSVAELKQE